MRQPNEVYVINWCKDNPTWAALDAANVADGHYASKERKPLVVKAEAVEAYYKAQIDACYDEAERDQTNPWDKLIAIPHYRAIADLNEIKAYYDGQADCTCAPDGSTTCKVCAAMAHVMSEYDKLIEEE